MPGSKRTRGGQTASSSATIASRLNQALSKSYEEIKYKDMARFAQATGIDQKQLETYVVMGFTVNEELRRETAITEEYMQETHDRVLEIARDMDAQMRPLEQDTVFYRTVNLDFLADAARIPNTESRDDRIILLARKIREPDTQLEYTDKGFQSMCTDTSITKNHKGFAKAFAQRDAVLRMHVQKGTQVAVPDNPVQKEVILHRDSRVVITSMTRETKLTRGKITSKYYLDAYVID